MLVYRLLFEAQRSISLIVVIDRFTACPFGTRPLQSACWTTRYSQNDPDSPFSRFLRGGRATLWHHLVLPLARTQPADLLLATEETHISTLAASADPAASDLKLDYLDPLFRPLCCPTSRGGEGSCRTFTSPSPSNGYCGSIRTHGSSRLCAIHLRCCLRIT